MCCLPRPHNTGCQFPTYPSNMCSRRRWSKMARVETPVDVRWSFAPVVIAALLAYLTIYVWRWRKVRREDGPRGAPVDRLVLWIAGVLLIAAALISPVDHLGEQLASAHMVQ